MKSEFEKMMDGELYNFHDPEVNAAFARSKEILVRLNNMTRRDPEFPAVLRELIPDMPESSTISVPFLICMPEKSLLINYLIKLIRNLLSIP